MFPMRSDQLLVRYSTPSDYFISLSDSLEVDWQSPSIRDIVRMAFYPYRLFFDIRYSPNLYHLDGAVIGPFACPLQIVTHFHSPSPFYSADSDKPKESGNTSTLGAHPYALYTRVSSVIGHRNSFPGSTFIDTWRCIAHPASATYCFFSRRGSQPPFSS